MHDQDGTLICPHCGCEGDPAPPPDKELIRLFRHHSTILRMIRFCLVDGCTRGEAGERVSARNSELWQAMLERTGTLGTWQRQQFPFSDWRIKRDLEAAALIEDEAEFRRIYEQRTAEREDFHARGEKILAAILRGNFNVDDLEDLDDPDNTGLIVAPKWQPPTDDQQPDDPDSLTRWLEGQFTGKAA